MSRPYQRLWTGYCVRGNSPQLAEDSRHLRVNSLQCSPQLLPDSRHLVWDSRHLTGGLPSLEPRTPVIGSVSNWQSQEFE